MKTISLGKLVIACGLLMLLVALQPILEIMKRSHCSKKMAPLPAIHLLVVLPLGLLSQVRQAWANIGGARHRMGETHLAMTVDLCSCSTPEAAWWPWA